MELGSEELNKKLRNYKPSSKVEELMVELLLIPEDANDEEYAAMTDRFCNELSDEEFDTVQEVRDRFDDTFNITY